MIIGKPSKAMLILQTSSAAESGAKNIMAIVIVLAIMFIVIVLIVGTILVIISFMTALVVVTVSQSFRN